MFVLLFIVTSCFNFKLKEKNKIEALMLEVGSEAASKAGNVLDALGLSKQIKPIIDVVFTPSRWAIAAIKYGLDRAEEKILKGIEDKKEREEIENIYEEYREVLLKEEVLLEEVLNVLKKDENGHIKIHDKIELNEKEYTYLTHILIEKGCCKSEELNKLIKDAMMKTDSRGRNPFMVAVESENTEIVEYIINGNYPITKGRKDGMKPIHVIASLGNMQMLEMYKKNREYENSHKSLIKETNTVNGIKMNTLAYACLHGQYDIAKRLIEEFKMESIEGYLLAGLIGREDITKPFKDKYSIEKIKESDSKEDKKRKEAKNKFVKEKIFNIGNGNNLLHLLPILEYMKRVQQETKKGKYIGMFSHIRLEEEKNAVELLKELGVEEDLIEKLIIAENGQKKTPLEHAILSNDINNFKDMFEMVKELEIKAVKERCLKLSIEQNSSEIYEYLKDILKEEFKEEFKEKIEELDKQILIKDIKDRNNEIAYLIILEHTKGDKRKEKTKEKIREIEDIAIEEGNEFVLNLVKELRNTDDAELRYHVVNNQIEVIEKDVNGKDRLGVSYLSYACRYGNEEVVDLIKDKSRELGKDLKLTRDRFGRNGMHEATESNCINIIRKLPKEWMKEKDDEGETALFRLNRVETLDVIKEILGEDFKELLKERNKKGQNVLMKVIERYEGTEEIKGKRERLEELSIFLMDNRELLIDLEKRRDARKLGMKSEDINRVVDMEGNNILHYITKYSEEGIEIDLLNEETYYKLSKQENKERELPRTQLIEKDNDKIIKRMYEKHEEKRRKKRGESMMLEALRENSHKVIAMLIEKGISSEVRRGLKRSNSMESIDGFDYGGVIKAGVEIGSVRALEEVWKYEAKFPKNMSNITKKILEEKISENNEDALNWIMDKYVVSKGLTEEKDKELIFKIIGRSIIEGRIKFFEKALENEDIKREIVNYEYGEQKYILLSLATYLKDKEMLKGLIEVGADVDKAMEDGCTALMIASVYGYAEIVELLVEKEAEVDKVQKYGATALILASEEGHVEVVKQLLEAGAQVNIEIKNGKTSLILASTNGHKEIVKLLLEAGSCVDKVAKADKALLRKKRNDKYNRMLKPCLSEDLDQESGEQILKLMIESGIKRDERAEDGSTSLMIASRKGHKEVVEILLKRGADVNVVNEAGVTALIFASEEGHVEVVKLLLEAKADVNAKDDYNSTALILASYKGHKEVVKLLLEAKADVDAFDNNNSTALILALENGYEEVAYMLFSEGATIDIEEEKITKILVGAIYSDRKNIVELLLKNRVDIEKSTSDGITPLIAAIYSDRKNIVELLLDKGADIEKICSHGFTPLIVAIHFGKKDIVNLLLDRGADIEKPNSDGRTPLEAAISSYRKDIVELLLDRAVDINNPIFEKKAYINLYAACKEGDKEAVKILLKRKEVVKDTLISSDSSSEFGFIMGTDALTISIINGHEEIVKMLIDSGVEIEYELQEGEYKGKTPLDIAKKFEREDIIRMVEEKIKENREQESFFNFLSCNLL